MKTKKFCTGCAYGNKYWSIKSYLENQGGFPGRYFEGVCPECGNIKHYHIPDFMMFKYSSIEICSHLHEREILGIDYGQFLEEISNLPKATLL